MRASYKWWYDGGMAKYLFSGKKDLLLNEQKRKQA